MGEQLVWDVTNVDAIAPSRLNQSSLCNPGTTATEAEAEFSNSISIPNSWQPNPNSNQICSITNIDFRPSVIFRSTSLIFYDLDIFETFY